MKKALILLCIFVLFSLQAGCSIVSEETPVLEPASNQESESGSTVARTTTSDPISCNELEGNCLELTFDGESCDYEGPTGIKTGTVKLLFFNKSEGSATVNLLRHTGDETLQDVIEYIGEEPTTKHHPDWTEEVGTWWRVAPEETYIWEGSLEPDLYHMICVRYSPLGGWFGGGFTVTD
jgi:hypothetical protein